MGSDHSREGDSIPPSKPGHRRSSSAQTSLTILQQQQQKHRATNHVQAQLIANATTAAPIASSSSSSSTLPTSVASNDSNSIQSSTAATGAPQTPTSTVVDDEKPSLKRASTAPRILISPPSTVSQSSLNESTTDAWKMQSNNNQQHHQQHDASLPPLSPTLQAHTNSIDSLTREGSSVPSKRHQYLSLDYLPSSITSSSSTSSHSFPSEVSSLLVSSSSSPLSAPSSSSSNGSGSTFGSNNSSLSLAASSAQRDQVTSASSSGSNSTSSSPKIAARLQEHHQQQPMLFMRRQPHSAAASASYSASSSSSIRSPHNSPSSAKLLPSSPPGFATSLSEPSTASSASSNFLTLPSTPPSMPSTRETAIVRSQTNAAGQKQLNQYVVEPGDIGRGSYGSVKLVYNVEDHKHYAMKVMNKSLLKKRRIMGFSRQTSLNTPASAQAAANALSMAISATNGASFGSPLSSPHVGAQTAVPTSTSASSDHWMNVQREIAIMKKLDHQNIVRLYEVMDDPNTDNLYLIMEYMNRGAVMSGDIDKLHALDNDRCWHYFRDVVMGLEYLHFQKVIHRDLKPENLLLSSSSTVKISDFGVSMLFEGNNDLIHTGSTTVGSAAFMPPELCGGAGIGTGGSTLGSGSGGIQSATPKASPVAAAPAPSPRENRNQPTQSLLESIAAQMRLEQEAKEKGVYFDARSFSLPATPITSPSNAGGGAISSFAFSKPPRPTHLRTYSSDTGSSPALVSGKKSDIWSAGITLFVMEFGYLPFMANTVALIYRAIVEDPLVFPPVDDPIRNPNHISEATEEGADLMDLLRKMLDKNPHTRLDICQVKQHPWVTKRGLDPLEDQCDYEASEESGIVALGDHHLGGSSKRLSLSSSRRAARAQKIAEREAKRKEKEAMRDRAASGTKLDPTQEEDEVDEDADTEELPTSDDEEQEEQEEAKEVVNDLPDASNSNHTSANSSTASTPQVQNRRFSKRASLSGSYQPITLSKEEMAGAVTLVSRVVLVVKLKAKMRRHRLQLEAARGERDRSSSMGDEVSPSSLEKPILLAQSSCPSSESIAQAAANATSAAAASAHSKRSSHATFALLSAARGAINSVAKGDATTSAQPSKSLFNAREIPKSSAPPALPDDDEDDSSSSSTSPAVVTGSRLPLFPHRKNSRTTLPPRLNGGSILADASNSVLASSSLVPPSIEGLNMRHQSAPLRAPPALYVPLATLAQQPQSMSMSNLESDDLQSRAQAIADMRSRTVYAVTDADAHALASMDALILPRAMMQHHQHGDDELESDESFDDGEVAAVEPDAELDI